MAYRHHILALILAASALTLACNDAPDAQPRAQHEGASTLACQGPEDCSADELCVAAQGDEQQASCVAQCSIDQGDVCPEGEYCARVVGMNGHRAAACVEGTVKSHQSWQRCNRPDECNDNENCVALDDVLGARCVPACTADNTCVNQDETCALHWEGEDGAQSGCVQQCATNADCERGWTCQQGSDLTGICVR